MHRCQTEVFTAFSKAVLHVALCGDREADGPNAVRKIVRELCSTSAKTRRFWEVVLRGSERLYHVASSAWGLKSAPDKAHEV